MLFSSFASSSKGNLYSLHSSKFSPLLLECGVPFRKLKELLNFELSGFSACLLTHEHQDHAKSVHHVLKAGIDVYCSEGTAIALDIELHHRTHILEPEKLTELNGWKIIPFLTQHDAKEPLGFYISDGTEQFLFATDTFCIRPKFKGLNQIAIECNYSKYLLPDTLHISLTRRLIKSHMSLETTIKFLQANDLSNISKIYLLHLSSRHSDAKMFQKKIQEITGKEVVVANE